MSNQEKIKLLKQNISEADERQNKLLFKLSEFKGYLASERITYAEYEWLLSHYLRGKSLNEWLFYYENYKLQARTSIAELERICSEERAPKERISFPEKTYRAPLEKKAKEGINAAYLIPLLVVFALVGTFFLGNAITGYMTVEFPLNESWDIGSSYVRVSMSEYSEDKALAEFVNGSIVSVDLEKFSLPSSGTVYVDLIVSGLLADSKRVEYVLENATEELNTAYYEPITPLGNITEIVNATEPIAEEPLNITIPENFTEEINLTEPLNITLPENITNATIEFNLSSLNLTHVFDDEAVGGIRTGEVVLWQRHIVGGDKEAESFYREADNIILIKEADIDEHVGGSNWQREGIRGNAYAFGHWTKEEKEQLKEALKEWKKLNKKDAGNESYAPIEEPEQGVDYFIFYETPAPSADIAEQAVPLYEDNKITVTVSAPLHYTNVTVAYPLANYKARQFTVYWIVNETRIKMSSVGEDINGDGVEDNLLWVAPHLSNQTFELKITVINVYESPAVGSNWTVFFNTTGTGNLSIEPFNDLLDGPWEEMKQGLNSTSNEMELLELYCGEERVTDELLIVTNESERRHGDISDSESIASRKILLPNYTCDGQTSSIINKMDVPGYISMNFTFANDYGSVSSYAFDPPSQGTPTINTTYGTNLTTENITAFNVSSVDTLTNIWDWRKNGVSDAVLNMPFDINGSNGNTSNVKDYSSFGNNGTHNGTITCMPKWNASCTAFTGSGGCYEFNGIEDSIILKDASSLEGMPMLTLAIWFKPILVNSNKYLIYKELSYLIRPNNANIFTRLYNSTGATTTLTSSGTLNVDYWNFVVVTYDGNTIRMYINGTQDATTTAFTGAINNGGVPSLGGDAATNVFFNGSIDQVMIWNRTLSASEITMLYNSGIGMYNRVHSDATSTGDIWQACVTPNDGTDDGSTLCSANLTIQSGCTAPADNLAITNDTTLCMGTYYVTDAAADGILLPGNNSGITIRCNETTIIGNGTGYGIYGSNDHNITLTGCDIRNYTFAVYGSTARNWTIVRNNLTVPAGNTYAIYLYLGMNHTIKNNNITSTGTNNNGDISLNSINSSFITSNRLMSRGTSTVMFLSYSDYNNITGNVIESNGSTLRMGISMDRCLNTIISYNSITTNGSSGHGIYQSNGYNNSFISYNNITTRGDSAYGIYLDATDGAIILKNQIYANGSSSLGIAASTSVGTNVTLNNITGTSNAIVAHNGWNVYGNILAVLGTGNVINAAGASSNFWMNNLESTGGVTGGSDDTFCMAENSIDEGNFYAAGTAPADIPSGDCGAANITYPDGGEAFNVTYINVTWKKQSHSPLKALWYSFAFSNDSGTKWQELRSVWGYQNVYNHSVNATYKKYRWQSLPAVKNGTYITIPKAANITRAVFKVEYIASSVFQNATGYTGNASFQRQYELFGNASADGLGRSIAVADVNNDGIKDIIAGSPTSDICTDGSGGDSRCGGAQVWLGYSSGGSFSSPYDYYLRGVNASDEAGRNVASCDVNNDSISDIIMGAAKMENGTGYTGSCSGTNCGGVIVYFGINAGGAFNSTPDLELYGMNASDSLALGDNHAPVACGDINNDSIADIVWGAPGADSNASSLQDRGSAIVYFGKNSGQAWNTTPDLELFGSNDTDYAGYSIGVGDVNNDGIRDILLGAVYADEAEGAGTEGSVVVYFGKAAGQGFSSTADAEFFGVDAGDAMGAFGAVAADVNNDGINDLVTSSYYSEGGCKNATASNCGSAVIFYGPITAGVYSTPNAELFGTDDSDKASINAGDIDNDGIQDILLGGASKSAPGEEHPTAKSGGLNIYYGIDSVHGETLSTLPDVELFGYNNTDACTEHVYSSFAEDIDNDGYNEVILGCKDASDSGGSGEGSVQVFDPWNIANPSLTQANITVLPETGTYAPCKNAGVVNCLDSSLCYDYTTCVNGLIATYCSSHVSQNCTLNVTLTGYNGSMKLYPLIEYTGFWWNITNSTANNIIDSVNYWINVTPFESVTNANATYTQTNFTIDHTLPSSITLNAWAGVNVSVLATAEFDLNWTATDNLGMNLTCQIAIDMTGNTAADLVNIPCISGALCNRRIGRESSITEGIYRWNVTCNDTAGNANISATSAFGVDRTAPSITEINVTARDPSLRIINWSNSVDVGTAISFRAIISDAVSGVSAVWVKIWKTTKEAGILLWEGFMRLIEGTAFSGVWEVNWTTNASLPTGLANYTIYVNDTANNTFEWEGNFSVNYKPEQGQPLLTSGFYNTTYGNLTCSNVSTSDQDGDAVVNVFDFRLNGASDNVLNMPFEGNRNATQAKDYSTWGNNGTLGNGSTGTSTYPIWNSSCNAFTGSGGCYEFDGSSDTFRIRNSNSLYSINYTGTIAAWINAKGCSGQSAGICTMLDMRGTGNGGFLVYYSETNGDIRVQYGNSTAVNTIDTSSVAFGNWYMFVASWNTSGMHTYLNGIFNYTKQIAPNISDVYATAYIGSHSGLRRYFNGSIDQVMVWNRTLSASEIASLYNAGSPQYNKIEKSGLSYGQNWTCAVTPNDGLADGNISVSGSLVIATQNVTVNLTSPLDGWYVNNTAKFECTASTNVGMVNVSLWHNNTGGALARNATLSSAQNFTTAHFTVTGLSVSNFSWTCQACDSKHECFFANENRTLIVDITSPVIEFVNPTRENNTKLATNMNNIYVNVSITEASNNYSAFIDWNRSLVGYWRLEQGNGTWFADSSTWGNNGTCSTTACPNLTMGMRGKAYKFDGSDDKIGLSNDLSLVGTSWTISFWAISAKDRSMPIGENTGNSYIALYYDIDQIYFSNSTGAVNYYVTATMNLNNWDMFTFIGNLTDITAYMNGRYLGVAQAGAGTHIGSGFIIDSIGWSTSNPAFAFNGSLDEVMVWNRALSPEEINASFSAGVWKLYRNFTSLSSGTYTYKAYVVDQAGNLNNTEERTFIVNAVPVVSAVVLNSTYGTNLTTENLTAYVTSSENDSDGYTLIYDWKKNGISDAVLNMPFDINGSNGNTSNVKDYSSFGNNGTHNGTIAAMPRWNASCGAFTGSGGCYEFDGIEDSIILKDTSSLEGMPGLTLAIWFKPILVNSNKYLIYKELSYLIRPNNANIFTRLYNSTGATTTLTSSGTLNVGYWNFVVVTYDGNTIRMYINGTQDATTKAFTGAINNGGTPVLGGDAVTVFFNGSLEQIMIWNRSLSASEISMLYNSGAGMYNHTHSDATTNGDVWYVVVTPADKYEDGTPVASNNVTIAAAYTYVNLTSPLDNWYVNNTVKFECFAASNIPLVNVSLWHNNTGTWARNATVTTTANSVIAHYTVTGMDEKNVVWTCQACTAEGCTYSTINRTLFVDITVPQIEFHSSSETNNTKKATANNFAYINTSISDASNNVSAFIDWNRSLVGWWRLEDTNGTWFADSSTWGNNGTCSTTACPNLTMGMRGKAYKFDGSDDKIGLSNDLSLAGTSWTISFWAISAKDRSMPIGENTGNSYIALYYDIDQIYFSNSTGAVNYYVTATMNLNNWDMFTFIGNLTDITAYMNGRYLGVAQAGAGTHIGSGFIIDSIGWSTSNPAFAFNGSLDEVMVWNRALSPEEINASFSAGVWKLYHNFTGLTSGTYTYKAYVVDQAGNLNNTEERTFIVNSVPTQDYPTINTTLGTNLTTENITAFNVSTTDADNDAVTNIWNWYRNGTSITLLNMPFDTNDSSLSKDYSGFGNNGTLFNGVRWTPNGKSGGAYYFKGDNDFINLTYINLYDNSFTLEAWVFPNDSTGSSKAIFEKKYGTGNNGYLINQYGTTLYVYVNNSGNLLTVNNFFTIGAWQHVAFIFRNSDWNMTVYNNGVPLGSAIITPWYINNTNPTLIGMGTSSSTVANAFPYNGTIDEVRIWNVSLTAAQVAAIYNGGTPRYDRIEQSTTSSGETWSACLTPNDGYDDGATMCTRANITINTAPSKVILDTPTHGNITMTNRSVSFSWLAATDTDGDSLTYNLSIKCYATAGGSCFPSDDRDYGGISGITYNLSEATELRYLRDDNYFYNWTVTAHDGFEYGDISNQSNFSISSEVIVSLINDTVNFGNIEINAMDNTTDFNPYPMRLENKGNVITTVNLSSATSLFSSGGFPSSYYKLRVNATSGYENSFSNNASSQITWTNVPIVNQTLFDKLNYSTGRDRGDIHLHVQVPNDEPAGSKSSILTLTGWYAL